MKRYHIPKRDKPVKMTVEEIYNKYRKIMLQQVKRDKTIPQDFAEDIVQDTFYDILKYYDSIKWEKGYMERFLSHVLSCCHKRHVDKFVRNTFIEVNDRGILEAVLDGNAIDPLDKMINESNKKLFSSAVEKLSPAEYEVFYKYFNDKLTLSEIAEQTGRASSTANVLLRKARHRIIEELRGVKEDDC